MAAQLSRRAFLRAAGLTVGGSVAASAAGGAILPADPAIAASGSPESARLLARQIQATVRPPDFPNRTFSISDYGAIGDGTTDCTAAVRAAITACNSSGGGHVLVPDGTFVTGAVHLLSNVDLHLSQNATLRFSTDPAAYLPAVYTRWQGIELMNYSPFIYAYQQHDIAVTGSGTLDGAADWTHWWNWSGADDWTALQQMADNSVPVPQRIFGSGHQLRPNFIQPYRCRNVLIEGVTIVNSPMWEIHPVLCRNTTIRNVTVDSHGPNNDGCDPESCSDVVIADSVFDAGDDCIAIKSGREADGRRINVPCENVIIRGCQLRNKYGAIAIGSEMTGGVRNVVALDCTMGGDQLHYGLYVKANALMGGFAEDIHLAGIVNTALNHEFISINLSHGSTATGPYPPTVRNINVCNVRSQQSRNAWSIIGLPNDPIRDIRLANCDFANVAQPSTVTDVLDLKLDNVYVNGERVPS